MSYPDPPNQPPWMPPGPYGGGQPPAGMGQPAPYQPAPRRSRMWMVPVAAVLGVALMATAVWASTSVVRNLFGGPQPESVLPGSSLAFAKLDLKPSGAQLSNYAQFVNKLPDSMKDEIDPDADPAKELVEEEFDYLDYEDDVEPWLGKRFGVSAWQPSSEDAAPSGSSGGSTYAVALAIEDQDSAEEALAKVKDEEEDVTFEVRDDFAILAPNDATISDLDKQVEKEGVLEDNTTFDSDMTNVGGDGVAGAWADLEGLSKLEDDSGGSTYDDYDSGYDDPFGGSSTMGDVKGRMALNLSIEGDYLELRGDMFDVSVNGVSTADYETPKPGLDAMADLPGDTAMAVGGNDMDEIAKQAWKENGEELDPDGQFESAMDDLGSPLPDGFTDLLGDKTALGVTDLGGAFSGMGGADPSFQFRAHGADSGLLEDITTGLGGADYGSTPGVETEGDATVVSQGSTGSGKLGDDAQYKKVMQGMDDTGMGFYMNLEQPMEEAGEAGPEQWGAVGASLAFEGDTTSLTARWAPNGGA